MQRNTDYIASDIIHLDNESIYDYVNPNKKEHVYFPPQIPNGAALKNTTIDNSMPRLIGWLLVIGIIILGLVLLFTYSEDKMPCCAEYNEIDIFGTSNGRWNEITAKRPVFIR